MEILFEKLMMEVLSWLPVKSLVRFTCASKWFQSLISDSSFVKLHLQRSPKSEDFLLICSVDDTLNRFFILSCPAIPLVSDDPLSLIADDHSLGLELNDTYEIAGACNGLRSVCLANERDIHTIVAASLDGVYLHDFYSDGDDEDFISDQCFGVLKDCLSLFLHSRKTKHLAIWQMKEFGNQNSWTLSQSIAIQDLEIDCMPCHDLLPLIMYEELRMAVSS
ncbi:uncharacterized protein [Glycine max]|uniref:uncharacterized protein n=1 Tax=Glycine max TaxID=3847 RepID=UPI0003DE7420|nr:uncharacterized protein LOC102669898 [Glycine max]|eukprot:XP_006584298.1 uncharacterized protein LOC102669898 [Glycine max]